MSYEDEEEFSYSAYSAETEKQLKIAKYVEREEAFTEADTAEEKPRGFSDYLVQEISAHANVPKFAKLTGLPADIISWLYAALYFSVGVLCVSITEQIIVVLPYLVGGMMILLGLIQFIYALVKREYRSVNTNKTATSLIIIALGIMIILQHVDPENNPITFISVVWGILGLLEGAYALNRAFKKISDSERCIFYILKAVVECTIAFLLLYNPSDHNVHNFHIIVFGVNLIVDSITLIPPVKKHFEH